MATDQLTADLARQDDHDIDQILALNRLEYGADDILVTRADFAWRCEQNPAGQAIIPVIRNRRGDVVGFILVVPLRLRIKGWDYLSATVTDLVIHPEYRNTFGYTKLIRKFERVFQEYGISLHASFVSEETYRGLREQKPQTVTTIPILVKPLDLQAIAQTYFTKAWQRFALGRIGRLVSPIFFRQRPLASREEVTVEAIDQFDEGFNEFWHKVKDKYRVMVIRDRAFLAWRFASLSGRHYCILVARVSDQMLGYTVLRCATIRGVKTGLIMDLLVTNDPMGTTAGAYLMVEAEAYFRAQGMSLIAGIATPAMTEYRILRHARYLNLPEALAPRVFRFAFFVHNSDQRNLISLSTRDWFITLADHGSS